MAVTILYIYFLIIQINKFYLLFLLTQFHGCAIECDIESVDMWTRLDPAGASPVVQNEVHMHSALTHKTTRDRTFQYRVVQKCTPTE